MYSKNFPFKRYQITTDFIKKHVDKNELILDLGIENPLSKILKNNGYNIINTSGEDLDICLLYTSPSPRDPKTSRMPSSA